MSASAPFIAPEVLGSFEGRPAGDPFTAPEPVNRGFIRNWVEAISDENPVYVDEGAAAANGFAGIVAPPTMLQAWIMRGYKAHTRLLAQRAEHGAGDGSAMEELTALLDAAGFTSVVATNCEQRYYRPLVVGDHLSATSVIESVSGEKVTALGTGHFVTTRTDFTDQNGEQVATMRFRILKFRPKQKSSEPEASGSKSPAPRRPRPAISKDNAFFFEATKQGKLLIQSCASCGQLRHPPLPACPQCRSLEWDTVEASGRGSLFSFVVVHHPQVPGFDYPLPIGLVELEEGTRIVADLIEVDPARLEVGMPLELQLVAVDEDLTLPMFRPVSCPGGSQIEDEVDGAGEPG